MLQPPPRTSTVGQSKVQLRARAHAELREGAIEMRCDGPMREIRLLADLAVGEALRREPSDLKLLRGQERPAFWIAVPRVPTGGAKLLLGSSRPCARAQCVEHGLCGCEWPARLSDPALAAQPRS